MSTYLWQNFLKDSSIIAFISDAIQKLYHTSGADVLVEIWPWKWAITKKIKQISPSFFVVEKDITMKDHLMSIGLEESQITFWDVLETDIVWLLYNIWKTEIKLLLCETFPIISLLQSLNIFSGKRIQSCWDDFLWFKMR